MGRYWRGDLDDPIGFIFEVFEKLVLVSVVFVPLGIWKGIELIFSLYNWITS